MEREDKRGKGKGGEEKRTSERSPSSKLSTTPLYRSILMFQSVGLVWGQQPLGAGLDSSDSLIDFLFASQRRGVKTVMTV